MSADTQPLEKLYKATGGEEYNEFIPISDDTMERYAESLDQAESLPPGPGQHKGARNAAKPKRRRSRNAHQLHLNKLAQVRYRERKRQKQEKLESEVQELNDKAAELQQLEQQSAELEAQNVALQQQLAERQTELQRAQQAAAAAAESASGSKAQRSAAEKKAELDRLVQKWLATVEEIRQLYRLLMMDPSGRNAGAVLKRPFDAAWLPPGQQRLLANVTARVDMLVETVVSLCVRVLRLDGPRIEDLMAADYERCSSLAGWQEEAKWLSAARELNLSQQQVATMLRARTGMLGRLQSLYTERQQLNAEALSALGSGEAGLTEAEQQRVFEILGRLEANLRAEQRAVAEQEFVTFKHLLTPIQACPCPSSDHGQGGKGGRAKSGLFILKAFPQHCDCLALLNAVSSLSPAPPL